MSKKSKSSIKSTQVSLSSSRLEHFRGVIWPREKMPGPKGQIYRYPIVGMILSNQPIEKFEGKNQIILDGSVSGISDILENTTQKEASHPLGDASTVMCSLSYLVKEE